MKTVTLSEFAKLRGVHKSTVTRYKQTGRLVFTDDGLVDVEASNQKIADTADPNRDDVVRRHKKNKETKETKTGDEEVSGGAYQEARAKKEKYHALQAKADYEKSIGLLVERAEVDKAWVDVAVIMRSFLERIPDTLAADLASESDTNRISAILIDQIELVLKQAADQIKALT